MSMRNLFDIAQAVSLRTTPKSSIQPFIVLDWGTTSGRAEALAAAFALTPRVMEWGEGFWLLDITACLKYWSTQAMYRSSDPLHMMATQLHAIAKQHDIQTWSGATAAHPWQALLLSRHIRERKIRGFLSVDSPLGQTLFRELCWDSWRQSVESLAAHRWALGIKPSDPTSTRKQLNQLERAVKRMGLRTPWALRDIPGEQLRRRFGGLVHEVCNWAYRENDQLSIHDTGFPWQPVVVEDKPQVIRHLDQPLCEWDHIQPLLREDLDRLCALATWQAGERVVSLEWRLVFHDLANLAVPIRFRHPHPLHLERGAHATALLQALYAFQSSVPRQSLVAGDEHVLEADAFAIPIISWTLVVDERLQIPSQTAVLFDDGTGGDAEALFHMENRLKIELAAYQCRSDWLPEGSFGSVQQTPIETTVMEALPSLQAVAKTRPLFIYETPQAFEAKTSAVMWEFCERTAGKWWDSLALPVNDSRPLIPQRDYYRFTDRRQRSYWVYRDTQSRCFVHGVYA